MQNEKEQVPEWLDEKFLATAIQSYKSDESIKIVKFEVNLAFAEHFASKMYRSTIEFKSIRFAQSENDVLNVVIKVKPINDAKVETVVSGGPLFETEMEMYEKVIPAMERLYRRHGINIQFAPELIYITSMPTPVIILKDLTPDGYEVYRTPLDHVDDSELLIKRLAQFHAASIYLAESNEVDVRKFNYTIYKSENILDHFFRDSIRAYREVVEGWDGCDVYLPKIDDLIKNIGAIGIECYTPNARGCGFNVLNHGDFHLRNILIKPNSEHRIENFCFVDYQLNVWCSPVVDLTYIMAVLKVDFNNADEKAKVIVSYQKQLENALMSIGYMGASPSLLDVNMEILKHGAMNIAIWINFFPFLFVDWSKVSIEDMMGNDGERSRNFKKNLYNIPALKELLIKEMKDWMYKGWW